MPSEFSARLESITRRMVAQQKAAWGTLLMTPPRPDEGRLLVPEGLMRCAPLTPSLVHSVLGVDVAAYDPDVPLLPVWTYRGWYFYILAGALWAGGQAHMDARMAAVEDCEYAHTARMLHDRLPQDPAAFVAGWVTDSHVIQTMPFRSHAECTLVLRSWGRLARARWWLERYEFRSMESYVKVCQSDNGTTVSVFYVGIRPKDVHWKAAEAQFLARQQQQLLEDTMMHLPDSLMALLDDAKDRGAAV